MSVTLNSQLVAQLEAGRDRLLELNASGEGRVEQLLEDIITLDSEQDLSRFMGRVFDAIGVQQDEKGNDCFILMPTESMVSQLPGLDPEGMTVTYKRRVATTLENVQFLSWDHPLVHTAMDVVLTIVHEKEQAWASLPSHLCQKALIGLKRCLCCRRKRLKRFSWAASYLKRPCECVVMRKETRLN